MMFNSNLLLQLYFYFIKQGFFYHKVVNVIKRNQFHEVVKLIKVIRKCIVNSLMIIVVGVCMHIMFRILPSRICVSVEQKTDYWSNNLSKIYIYICACAYVYLYIYIYIYIYIYTRAVVCVFGSSFLFLFLTFLFTL